MNFRKALAILLSGAVLAACAFLYLRSAASGVYALLFALAGFVAALCLRPAKPRADDYAVPGAHASAVQEVGTQQPATAAVSADDVPAGTLLEATMESMREGLLVVDSRMRVVASNDAARTIFGIREHAPASRRLSELTRSPAIFSAFAAAVARGRRAEIKVETSDAERRTFDLHVTPLRQKGREPHEEIRGAVGVFFDITRLERLERVRQEFLSNVSHELRTPLTAILTFVETLDEGAIDDPADSRRFLSIIRRNSERMRDLINDILELSSIEAGNVTVNPESVRLALLVNDCFATLSARACERRVALRNDIGTDVLVYADVRRLEQMLVNLLDNAIKFNAEGGTVHVAHERAEGRDRIHVSDEGEGIMPEHHARIFERFYRVDRARSRAMGGTGLGLAIVKHLARAHGGETSVRSAPGEGSTFTIELPAPTET